MAQDQKGFMWFGTQDGLNRYDGHTFKVYKNIPFDTTSISENFINALLVDQKNNLWVGTLSKGLHLFDAESQSFIHFQYNPLDSLSLSNNNIQSIYEDADGTIWIATANGFNRLEMDYHNQKPVAVKFHRYEHDEVANRGVVSRRHVLSIFKNKKNELWVGTVKGLIKYQITSDGQLEEIKTFAEELHINSVVADRQGTIRFASSKGFGTILPHTDSILILKHEKDNPTSITTEYIKKIRVDKDGNLLLATHKGLNILPFKNEKYGNEFIHIVHDPKAANTLHNNLISDVLEDNFQEGLYWLGTPLAGVSKMWKRTKQFSTNHLQTGDIPDYINPVVRHISKDDQGTYWVGTDYGIILVSNDRSEYKHLKEIPLVGEKDKKFHPGRLLQLHRDNNGNLWGTSRMGLVEFRLNKKGEYTAKLHQPTKGEDKAALCVLPENGGYLVGSWSGVNFFDFEKGSLLHDEPVAVDSVMSRQFGYHIKAFLKDKDDNLWIGTTHGLVLYRTVRGNFFDYKKLTPSYFYHNKNDITSLSSQEINTIAEDALGNIWLGTTNGLIKVVEDEGGISFQTFNEQHGLANNMVYGILNDGKYLWMSTNKGLSRLNPKTCQFDNFDINDGLQSNEFNAGAYRKAADGELMFGGINGFTTFFPEEIKLDNHRPQVWLTNFKTFDGKQFDLLANNNRVIRLPYKQNTFSIQFIGLDFLYPKDVTYFYDLEGSDEQNVPIGNSRQVNFTKLASGKYIFRIKAVNKDGTVNEIGDTLQIIIATPFWKTSWFYLILIAGFAGLVWFIFYVRYQYKMAKLAEIDRVRKNAAQDFHDELGSKLTIISMFSELTKSRLNGNGKEVSPYINKVIETSNSLYQSMKDLIWALNPEQDTVKDLYFQIKDFGDDLFDQTGIAFHSEGIADEVMDRELPMEYKRHILLIFKELMNNALKHSQCNDASLKMSIEKNQLITEFRDNGVGFNPEENSSGDGLKNIYSRAEKIGGKLSVSTNGKGTRVLLTCELKENSAVKSIKSLYG